MWGRGGVGVGVGGRLLPSWRSFAEVPGEADGEQTADEDKGDDDDDEEEQGCAPTPLRIPSLAGIDPEALATIRRIVQSAAAEEQQQLQRPIHIETRTHGGGGSGSDDNDGDDDRERRAAILAAFRAGAAEQRLIFAQEREKEKEMKKGVEVEVGYAA